MQFSYDFMSVCVCIYCYREAKPLGSRTACIYQTVEDVFLSVYLYVCISVCLSAQMKLFSKIDNLAKNDTIYTRTRNLELLK